MKKNLMMILAAAFGLSAWANPVAKVGTTEYETIDEAIAAWTSANNSTLTLLADVTLPNVVQLKSTEMHTLDLGTYTMTAAKNKNAIQILNYGRTSASYALDIKADATNPGGISAPGYACVYYKHTEGSVTTKDRPIIRIYGGVFSGRYCIQHGTSNGTDCPQFSIYGGTFNGTTYALYTNRSLNNIYGGTFNVKNMISPDSSAYTLIQGGKFVDVGNNYNSALNSDKWTYGTDKGSFNVDVTVDADGYYVVTKPVMSVADKETTYGASLKNTGTGTLAYSNVKTEGRLYYETATRAMTALSNGGDIELYTDCSDNKTLSSGTTKMTLKNSAAYTGNITLSGTSGAFTISFDKDVGYYGNVTASQSDCRISLSETEADGIVTRTYTVQGNTAITEANAEAAIVSANGSTTNYYGSVYDAFYAVDGNTEGKTIVLMKDAPNAGILTNGKAVNEAGKTVVTFDLNGHAFNLQSAGTGNDADYTLTVIDSSEEGTGEVMNTTFSLLKIALTGTGDYSGKYTLKVQGGTWHFNPSAVVYDGNTYDLVDEGYIAVDNGNGTWTVGKFLIETGDLHTDTVIGDDTTEAVYTISTTVKVGNKVVSTTDSQTINVSVPSDKDIGGTTLHSVNLDSLVESAVESAGVDAASVSKVEIFVSAVMVSEADGTITYDVKPKMIVTVTKGGVSTESEIELTNDDLAAGATFTFPLDVTALDVQVGGWVKVKHVSKDPAYADETMYLQAVAGENGKVVVMVTTSHFSTFTLSPLTSQPVTTSVQSANLFGAIKISGNVASNMYVAVPFEGFDGTARKAKDVVHPANLTAETKMYVYNKTSDSHDVYKVASGAWAPAVKVTINSDNAATLDAASLDRAVPAGTGVLVARANAGDNVYVYGQIPGAAVNPEPFAKGQTFVAPPYTNATVEVSGVKYIDLNASKWTGVSAAQQNRKLISGADFIQFRDANNRLIKFYYDGTSWGLQPTYAKLAAYKPYVEGGRALVPQGTAFWYCSSVGGAKVEWTK